MTPAPAKPVVTAAGLDHRYGKVIAVNDVSLKIPAGVMVGLIGPDGVGKSTLLGLIAGARKLQDGTLHVLDADMALAKNRAAVCQRIAYMPQGLGKNLYADLSVHENLTFFAKLFDQSEQERRRRIDRLTKATGLHPFLARPAGQLSGGMKQKLGLCCALIHDPDLLILDEPTTGVDPLSRRQFWQLIDTIRAERPGMSLIVSTAYMEEADAFDWLIAMDRGRIIGTGAPDDLKQQTKTATLEDAYVALQPGVRRRRTQKIELPPAIEDRRETAIHAKGLTRRFADFTAVADVDLTIKRGEIFGFLGSNGCGKTTTMKMLTGLLPPTAGKAELFGERVEAGSRDMRRRVGYMSQAFSLYGELTVRQNLNLHARLFDIPGAIARERIDQLVNRFDLSEHLDAASGELPLGLRQRLSLAVAVLHRPEMLILDEPTSGVDPQARDDFWAMLIELSRNEGVTIFISTHFMSEAMRCDRISLMHAGRVLAMGQPETLAASHDSGRLEDAFIAYMVEAGAGNEAAQNASGSASTNGTAAVVNTRAEQTAAIPQAHPLPTETPRPAPVPPVFSLKRALAYSIRETKEVMRDPVRLGFAFIGSTILLFIFSYGITTDVDRLTFAVLDQDQSAASRALIEEFEGSRYFVSAPPARTDADLRERLKSHDISVALEIPPGFGRKLATGQRPKISAWADGANTTRASTLVSYVQGVHQNYLDTLTDTTGLPARGKPATEIEMRFLYNPTFESIYAIAPGVPAMLLVLFPAILMAVSVAREKEIGTITNFYVSPTRRIEFLVGKQLPYIALAMANFLIMTAVVIVIFGVPLKGSFATLALGALVYAAVTTGLGLVISTFVTSQIAAVFATAIISMMPTMQFSGFLQPVSALEGGARVFGSLWPTTYYMHMSVGAFTKGLGFAELYPDIIALLAFVPVFLAIAVFGLRKQEP